MQRAVRPYMTAGVALVGASVIAVSPVAPPVPDIKVAAAPAVSSAMQLASATNPLIAFSELFSNTLTNASGLFEQFAASPAPILQQVLINQGANLALIANTAEQLAVLFPDLVEQIGANLREMATQLAAGDFVGAGQTLNETLIFAGLPLLGLIGPPLTILQNTTQNIANVFAELPNQVFPLLSAIVLSPVQSIINGTADIAQTVFDAVTAGDFLTAAGAVISAPIVMADVVLNGFGGAAGLLTPQLNFFTSGPIGALLGLRDAIADALDPIVVPAMANAANQAPDVEAEVYTLDVDAGAKTAEVVGASSVTDDDGNSSLAATEDPEGSGAAGALGEEDEGEEGPAEEQEAEEEAPVDAEDDDDTEPAEGTDEAEEESGAGEVRDSLVATPGETGLSTGGDAGDGSDASDDGPTAGDAGDSDNDGDAGGDAGGSESGSGGDE
ncbi:hypothetical protein [Mycolicibacterium pulveris]|uniref:hypothetical protein n=1 Tax=Mycolicibacterium pulveris TaxID=36813 RepID=UPI003CF85BF7